MQWFTAPTRWIPDGPVALQRVMAAFKGLDPNDPSQWPVLSRRLLCAACGLAVVLALWLGWLSARSDALLREQGREAQLRSEYQQKLPQALNLVVAKQQREEERLLLDPLERQLPEPSEMDALLTLIQTAGHARGLQFELWRPAAVTLHEHYAAAPVRLRVTGPYHGIGQFAAAVAQLPHAVGLHQLSLAPLRDRPGLLGLECTATIFRRLDPQERAASSKTQEHKP